MMHVATIQNADANPLPELGDDIELYADESHLLVMGGPDLDELPLRLSAQKARELAGALLIAADTLEPSATPALEAAARRIALARWADVSHPDGLTAEEYVESHWPGFEWHARAVLCQLPTGIR
jgi:hypothetical protein